MKTLKVLASAVAFVCLVFTCVIAQKHSKKLKIKSASMSRAICKLDSVPKGFVVVGYKASAECAAGNELIIKQPSESEIVCADSPIPNGYGVTRRVGSAACANESTNPLTNALAINSGNEVTLPAEAGSSRQMIRSVTRRDEKDENEPVPDRAQSKPRAASSEVYVSREEIDLAIRRSTVLLGMNMQDVSRAWGTSHTSDSLVEREALIYIWGYKRGRVYFRDGIVYKAILLKN